MLILSCAGLHQNLQRAVFFIIVSFCYCFLTAAAADHTARALHRGIDADDMISSLARSAEQNHEREERHADGDEDHQKRGGRFVPMVLLRHAVDVEIILQHSWSSVHSSLRAKPPAAEDREDFGRHPRVQQHHHEEGGR